MRERKRADVVERLYSTFGRARATLFSELQGSSDVGDPEHEAELASTIHAACEAIKSYHQLLIDELNQSRSNRDGMPEHDSVG